MAQISAYYDISGDKKVITKDGCAEGYRQCGILDTIGNILCIDETYDCPINLKSIY